MLSDSLTIADGIGNRVYVATKRLPDGVERLDDQTNLTEPHLLVIRHQTQGTPKAGNVVDRHLISFSRTEKHPDTGALYTAVQNWTLSVPRVGLFSDGECFQMKTLLDELLTSANLSKILRGES